jgi:hypothetical protein
MVRSHNVHLGIPSSICEYRPTLLYVVSWGKALLLLVGIWKALILAYS